MSVVPISVTTQDNTVVRVLLQCFAGQYLLNIAVHESAVNQSVNSYPNTYHHRYKMR